MMATLSQIQHYIATEQPEQAKRALVMLLRAEPKNVAAWMLLAAVINDVDKQADCYRHVLTLEPGHQKAASKLQQLTYRMPTQTEDGTVLRCPQCGGTMNIRFVGDTQDKRSVCLYCGTEVDLPDSYQRVEQEARHEPHDWGTHTVRKTPLQTHSDSSTTIPSAPLPDADFEERRSTVAYLEQHLTVPYKLTPTERVLRRLAEGLAGGKRRKTPRVTDEEEISDTPRDITPEEIIKLAGGPMPVEERRKCPKCQATISRSATRCEWCGMRFE